MKYDDASWHYGGNFPEGSPDEYGATHIALFMRWCFIKGWAGQIHQDNMDKVRAVISGELSATKYFLDYCDGKLTDEDFTDEGNEFVSQYYGDDGLFLNDYADNFMDLMYVEPEEKHDFELFSSVLDRRLKSSILTSKQSKEAFTQPEKTKPWWKFW